MSEYKSRTEKRQAMQQKQPKGKNKGNNKEKKKSLLKRIVLICLLLLLFFVLAGTITVFAIIKGTPELDPKLLRDPISTTILDNQDHKIDTVYNNENRIYAPIDKIPKIVQQAYISTEDARFYKHFGIDPYRIGGAVIANFKEGFGAEGASTITQQVIKNSYLTSKKTLTRKIQEAYLAIKLEQKYTKKQILEMYLNKIYLGEGNTYGVGTASKVYFGKNIQDVSLAQAAMLAALPKAPTHYDPLQHPEVAKDRRNLVLDLMVKHNAITQDQADQAKKVPMDTMLKDHQEIKKTKTKYNAFVNYVHHQLVDVKKVITDDEFANGGLTIHTTLEPDAQKQVENVLNNDSNFPGVQDNFEQGVSVVDTETGAIRALGGGRHYKFGTNWATNSDSQVGSTAKPIVDYGPAIEYLKWSTAHQIVDEPHTYSDGTPLGNYDSSYKGQMTIRQALAQSRNIPAVKTLQQVIDSEGVSKVLDFTNKLGFNFTTDKKSKTPFNETFAIGTFTASPLQMAGAYAAYGNNGVYNEPYGVKSIDFSDGKSVDVDHEQHVAMHDYTAYMVTDMLKTVVNGPHGTGTSANLPGVPLAGKTGTTNIPKGYGDLSDDAINSGALDEWFVGYTPKLTMSVWSGYTPSSKESDGTYLSAKELKAHYSQMTFKEVMDQLTSTSTADFSMPSSVVERSIEEGTGLLASKDTPSDKVIHELFVKGEAPEKVSEKYKSEKLKKPTNLKAEYDQNGNKVTLSWDYGNEDKISFDIAQKDGGSVGTTSDKNIDIKTIEPGRDYEFSVTAKSTSADGNSTFTPSDPATVKIKIPKIDENSDQNNNNNDKKDGKKKGNDQGSKKSDQSPKKLENPTSLQAEYNQESGTVKLSWAYGNKDGVGFDILQNAGGQAKSIGTTDSTSIDINNLTPGENYVFSVIAKPTGDNTTDYTASDPATVSIQIPNDTSTSAQDTNNNNSNKDKPKKKDGGPNPPPQEHPGP